MPFTFFFVKVITDFINRLSHKAYQNRKVGLIENGSWAPVAGKNMASRFESMKNITLCGNIVTIRSTMKESDLAAMEKLADAMLS